MAAPHVPTEDAALNMTPMIDIVFNLVTFFMLTLDLSRKELAALELPRAHEGTPEEKEETAAEQRYVVNLVADGGATFRTARFEVTSSDPETQARAWEGLRAAIAAAVDVDRVRRRPGPRVIVVRGDREVPWRRVQAVLALGGDARVRADRVRFAVEDATDDERRDR
jgi:biopolymer transport protein ExbD